MEQLRRPIEFETVAGTYVATAILGQGGSGRVFAAKDPEGSDVAIKLLTSSSSAEKRRRFKNELAFLERAVHPNLVQVFDRGVSRTVRFEGPFYVMPRYEGNLADLMKAGLSPAEAIGVFAQMLHGVEAAHLRNVNHRDLKPQNVLFKRVQGELKVVISDFGVAQFLQVDDQATLVETGKGTRLANFQYAAPEQRVPGQDVTSAADIFALGLMLHELYTGRVPHGAGYAPIGATAPAYAYLDAIVESMIQHLPRSRPSTIEAVKVRLRVEHEKEMTRQRISETLQRVVPEGTEDDPLVLDPVRVVDFDWSAGRLKLVLSQVVNVQWANSLQSLRGNYQSVPRAAPKNFRIEGAIASVNADEDDVQRVIDYFKEWLPQVNDQYKRLLEQFRAEARATEQSRLKAQHDEQEKRLRILSKVKI